MFILETSGDEDEAGCHSGSGVADGVDVSAGDGDDDDEAGGLRSVTDGINVSAGDDEADEADIYVFRIYVDLKELQ